MPTGMLDREARLAKLLNSACYGNKEATELPTTGGASEGPSVQQATHGSRSKVVPEILTASGQKRAPGAIVESKGNAGAVSSAQGATPPTAPTRIREGARVLGTGQTVHSNRLQKAGAVGFTPSAGRAAVSVEESRRAVANSGRTATRGSAAGADDGSSTVAATVRGELSSLYGAHHSAEGEVRRANARERVPPASQRPRDNAALNAARGSEKPKVAGDGMKNRNNVKTLADIVPQPAAAGRASAASSSSTLRNTTAAYRQSQGTTARRLEDVGKSTMTDEQRERVEKARRVVGKDKECDLPPATCTPGQANIHTIGGGSADARGTRRGAGSMGSCGKKTVVAGASQGAKRVPGR
ncbi:unnamed protein product [Amoebophrya sp. A120]|nr:unnamed protein product [Amoebophrya sp. A120]|eukprot:GSA120T00010977001.1